MAGHGELPLPMSLCRSHPSYTIAKATPSLLYWIGLGFSSLSLGFVSVYAVWDFSCTALFVSAESSTGGVKSPCGLSVEISLCGGWNQCKRSKSSEWF